VTDGSTVNFCHVIRVDAVQLSNAGQVGIEFKTGFFTHSFPVLNRFLTGQHARRLSAVAVSSSSPAAGGELAARLRVLSVLSREFLTG
jgi:hypothetical protein